MAGRQEIATEPRVNAISFNQTGDCCAYATTHGFAIHAINPQQESIRRDLGGASLSHAKMLYSTNIMVLVGEDRNHAAFPCTKAIIWDDSQQRAIGEICHGSPVKNVALGRNRLAVCLEHAVHIYNLDHLECIHSAETTHNPLGILDMATTDTKAVVATLGHGVGEVQLVVSSSSSDDAATRHQMLSCHRGHIAALALSPNGRYLATASRRGTILRIFNTEDGSKVTEVRRGTHPATIHSLAFSFDMPTWLACTSDTKTLHVFHLSTTKDHERDRHLLWFPWFRRMSPKRSCLQVSTETTRDTMVSFHASYPETLTLLSKDATYQRIITLVDTDRPT